MYSAAVFNREEAALAAIKTGSVEPGCVMVLRCEGPQACGMPEILATTEALVTHPALQHTAVITDGRYSSSRSRPFQFGTTTEADWVDGLLLLGWCLGLPIRYNRSASARAATGPRSRIGLSRSRGSSRRRRARVRILLLSYVRANSYCVAQLNPPGCLDFAKFGVQFTELRVQGSGPRSTLLYCFLRLM